ncbi:MAG: RNA-binding S4 domain-containing protein [Burkholderiaceae bacterium]|nr:MAG: RNA-binding S4 domain-containing protein [Burkholderiaceae bacterium]
MSKIRLDKWLWAARFFKTRSLAGDEIDKGRVQVNGQVAKASREVKAGDVLRIRKEQDVFEVEVLGISSVRGPAPQAQLLYQETEQGRLAREAAKERRRLAHEPANAIEHGRPTKKDRRQIADWNDRWTVTWEGEA